MRPLSLNHTAYVTWNTAATKRFYCDVLGMKLRGHASGTRVSTGETGRFLHTFFELEDGSHMAFFEIDGVARETHSTPVPPWARHIAFNVESLERLKEWEQRLRQHGVEYVGPTDHGGVWMSIYFFDPNGIRLELTYQSRELTDEDEAQAHAAVRDWIREHEQVAA